MSYVSLCVAFVIELLLCAWLAWLSRSELRRDTATGKRPSTNSLEALAVAGVALLGLGTWVVTQVTEPGPLHLLLQRPELARTQLAVLATTVLLTLALAWLGRRMSTAAAVVAIGLLFAWFCINVPDTRPPGVSLSGTQPSRIRGDTVTFALAGPWPDDAELVLDGVVVGKLPLTVNPKELCQRVHSGDPLVDTGPAGETYYMRTEHQPRPDWWVKAWVGDYVEGFYAQVHIGSEWGLTERNARPPHAKSLQFVFPERQRRLRRLLDQAVLFDYDVPAEWYRALASYGLDGVCELLVASRYDPRLRDLYAGLAEVHYTLPPPGDPDAAWALFERICDDVNAAGRYCSGTAVGKTVERLAPELPADRLEAALAAHVVGEVYPNVDVMEFESEVFVLHPSGGFGYLRDFAWLFSQKWSSPGREIGELRPAAYVVAHALWARHRAAAAGDRDMESIGRLLVRRNWQRSRPDIHLRALQGSPLFGGPTLDRFLTRRGTNTEQRLDGWGVAASCLRTAAGSEYRHRHRQLLFARVADQWEHSDAFMEPAYSALFLDEDLAREFWPRFRRLSKVYALAREFDYLTRLPSARPAEFADVWCSNRQWGWGDALRMLQRLPPDRRRAIVEALAARLDCQPEILERVKGWPDPHERAVAEVCWAATPEREKLYADRNTLATDYPAQFTELWQKGIVIGQQWRCKNYMDWMGREGATSPLWDLVAAKADTLPLRQLALRGIEGHPTPARRALLATWLADPDPELRAAAEKTKVDLDELAATPPMALASTPEGEGDR